jgi:hypothetical protein
MNRRQAVILLIVFLVCPAAMSQTDSLHSFFSDGTAYTLPVKKAEFRLYEFSGYGLSDRVEIGIHPLMLWIFPQVKLKVRINNNARNLLSTEHQLDYPTFFLQAISRKGIGGLISPEFGFPQMIAVYNGVLFTHTLKTNYFLTAKAGILFSLRAGTPDSRSTIDFPILYPRFAVYYHPLIFNPGLDIRGMFSSSFGGQINLVCYIVPGDSQNFFIENRGFLSWTRKKFQLKAGYLLSYGQYAYGNDWHLLPAIHILKYF